MKQPQYFITTFSLIVALTGLSAVMAADAADNTAGRARSQPLERKSQTYLLTLEEMDLVTAGRWKDNYYRQAYQNAVRWSGFCGDYECRQLWADQIDTIVNEGWEDMPPDVYGPDEEHPHGSGE